MLTVLPAERHSPHGLLVYINDLLCVA